MLKFIISDYVYRHFPDHQEGHLTVSILYLLCMSGRALMVSRIFFSFPDFDYFVK